MKKIITLLLALFPALGFSQTFTSNNLVHIPDGSVEVYDSVQVSGLPNTINSSFGLAGMCFDITHTFVADLQLRLKSPNGNSIFIAVGVGGNGDNFTGTCIAENGIDGAIVNGTAPFSGIYIPVESLNQFNNGQNPNGWWYFALQDLGTPDSGDVNFFSLTFSNNPPPDPLPPTPVCNGCVCPGGGGGPCDLLPDMTASALAISQSIDPVTHFSFNEIPGQLAFENATPNIGYGPIEIIGVDTCYCGTTMVPCTTVACPGTDTLKQKIHQVIYQKISGTDTLQSYTRTAGLMSYHSSHGHIHIDHWGDYTLRTATSNPDATTWPTVGVDVKQSYCLVNLGDCNNLSGYCVDTSGTVLQLADLPNAGLGFYSGCGTHQGIYSGGVDIYVVGLNSGINLSSVCDGDYYIVSVTDIENNMLESNENNNWVAVPVTLNQQTSAKHTLSVISALTIQATANNLTAATSYTWDFGDSSPLVSNVNPTSHTYAAYGTYFVTLTVVAPCGTFSKTDTLVLTPQGLYEYTSPTEFILAQPNPASEKLNINYHIDSAGKTLVELFDLAGKKVTTISNNPENAGQHSFVFDINKNNIEAGTYILKLTTHNFHQYFCKLSVVK